MDINRRLDRDDTLAMSSKSPATSRQELLKRCGIKRSLEPTTPVANRTAAQDGVAVQLDR